MAAARTAPAETIYAVATGPGRAAVAVVRISGPDAGPALRELSGLAELSPRRALRCRLRDANGMMLDDALVLWFPAPASFSGEDIAELHIHGGHAVVAAVMAALLRQPRLRLAEPGEFARRAFAHGKLDLTQAEALADLVDADTEQQRRQALRQLSGALGALYDGWRTALIGCMAHLEACIDFADEDIPDDTAATVEAEIAALRAEIVQHLHEPPRGERIRDGVAVVLLGAANAGKSSLMNALAGRDVAIVDPAPGTTRDVIEMPIDLGGVPIVLTDTAGLRASANRVEQEGVRRARARAAVADVRIVVVDGACWPALDAETATMVDARAIVVLSKADLLDQATLPERIAGAPAIAVSVRTGLGLEALRAAILRQGLPWAGEAEVPVITRARHRQGVAACYEALTQFADAGSVETQAEELRVAARALGRITGRVDVEDILDAVFRDFCIGK